MKEEAGILELSFQMGETLLKNGAEISRVQETMERVASAYQVETFHVYVLTNAIFAEGVGGDSQHSVELRHIPGTTTHLGRICRKPLKNGMKPGRTNLLNCIRSLTRRNTRRHGNPR